MFNLSLCNSTRLGFGFSTRIFSTKLSEKRLKKIKFFNEIAKELQVQMKIIEEGYILQFSKGNYNKYIIGYSFDLNSASAARICKEKTSAVAIFQNSYIPHVEHIKFTSREESISLLKDYAYNYNFNLVCKPVTGQMGIEVYHVQTLNELKKRTGELFKTHLEISLSPFYTFENEYRVVMLNHKPIVLFNKMRPHLIGDGISTVEELLQTYSTHNLDHNCGYDPNTLMLKKVLASNEILYLTWKHTLFTAEVLPIDSLDPLLLKVREVAAQATRAIGITFCCVDVVKIEGELTPRILEVNSAVMLEEEELGYKEIKGIYKKALALMLNNDSSLQ